MSIEVEGELHNTIVRILGCNYDSLSVCTIFFFAKYFKVMGNENIEYKTLIEDYSRQILAVRVGFRIKYSRRKYCRKPCKGFHTHSVFFK